jgi:magnesium transporter
MARNLKKKDSSIGTIPGEPIFIGQKKVDEITIHAIDYDSIDLNELHPENIKDLFAFKQSDTISWININGLHDTEKIRAIAEAFGLHPLVTEDIVNTGQRPKMEEYDDYLLFVLS